MDAVCICMLVIYVCWLKRWKNDFAYALHRTFNSIMIKKLNLEVRRSRDRFSDSYAMNKKDVDVCTTTVHNFPLIFFRRMWHVRLSFSFSSYFFVVLLDVPFVYRSTYLIFFFLFICGIGYKWTYGRIAPPLCYPTITTTTMIIIIATAAQPLSIYVSLYM